MNEDQFPLVLHSILRELIGRAQEFTKLQKANIGPVLSLSISPDSPAPQH